MAGLADSALQDRSLLLLLLSRPCCLVLQASAAQLLERSRQGTEENVYSPPAAPLANQTEFIMVVDYIFESPLFPWALMECFKSFYKTLEH